jgi:hypothetical protein
MVRRRRVVRLWILLGLLIAVILGGVAGPLVRAWRCYELNARGDQADAEIIEKLAGYEFRVRIAQGPHRSRFCNAITSRTLWEQKQLGDVVAIVFSPRRPDRCVLTSTLEASGFLIWSLSGVIAALILMIVLLGLFVHRSYAATHELTSQLDVDPSSVTCPECGAKMAEGYLAVLAGLHWREIGEPIGMPHALGGLPGTVGWRGRPRLHAFRCGECSVVTFKYGKKASPS